MRLEGVRALAALGRGVSSNWVSQVACSGFVTLNSFRCKWPQPEHLTPSSSSNGCSLAHNCRRRRCHEPGFTRNISVTAWIETQALHKVSDSFSRIDSIRLKEMSVPQKEVDGLDSSRDSAGRVEYTQPVGARNWDVPLQRSPADSILTTMAPCCAQLLRCGGPIHMVPDEDSWASPPIGRVPLG